MSKWFRFAGCVLLLLTGTVAETSAQTPKASAQPVKLAERFGDGEFRIGAEDVVEVFVANEDELSGTAMVRPDGKITVKLVGDIVAAGKTAKELESEIQTKFTKFLDTPKVNVVVKEVNSPKISVIGEVRKPDVYKIKGKTTALEVIALAGGFTEYAKKSKVTVIRGGAVRPEKFDIDLDSILKGKTRTVFYIEPGDTVNVQ